MSKPFVTVDYFSHQWNALDLGCAWQELGRQMSELRRKMMDVDHRLEIQHEALQSWGIRSPKSGGRSIHSLSKEKHRLLSDEYRLARLANIAWRQHKASAKHAPKVDPITINWQKASDVIWLYGPLFRRDDTDVDFEQRHGCPEAFSKSTAMRQHKTSTDTSSVVSTDTKRTTLKSALKKRQETKEEYVARLLGKAVLKRHKRRSFPVDRAMEFDLETTMAALDQHGLATGKKELRFKPNVFEYIYHSELPIRGRRTPPAATPASQPPGKSSVAVTAAATHRGNQACPTRAAAPAADPGTTATRHQQDHRSTSAACQRAKALLLAARSQPKVSVARPPCHQQNRSSFLPPSPPLSPAKEIEIRFDPEHANAHRIEPKTPKKKSWFWPFASDDTQDQAPPPQPTRKSDTSIPGLCANLISLSAEMVTLMGTAAIYKGVGYGLGCLATQQSSGVHWTRY